MELWEMLILLVGFTSAIVGIGIVFMGTYVKIKTEMKTMENNMDKDAMKFTFKKITETIKDVMEMGFENERQTQIMKWEHEAEEDSEAADWKKTAKKYARKYYSLYNEKNGTNKYDVDREVSYINRLDYEDD